MITALYILSGLLALVILLHLLGPKSYDVFRTVEIARPPSEVFNYLKYLKNMDDWSPWAKKDPNMKKEFTGIDGEVGAVSYWLGNKEVGEGEQEIKKIIGASRIESELRFLKPFKSTSDCYLDIKDNGTGNTTVKWGFSGSNKFPMTIMSLFKSMDNMVGPDFEEGMKSLKAKLES